MRGGAAPQPIVWPEPTHCDPASDSVKSGKLKPWRTAAECIDWSISCPSIFDSKEEIREKHGLRAVRPLADNTLARVARGLHRYVLQADRPFLVNLTHGGRVEDVAEPFKTITGANRGEKAVVAPSLVSVAHGDSGGRRERKEKAIKLDWQGQGERLDLLYWQCETSKHDKQVTPAKYTWSELIEAWRLDPRVQGRLSNGTKQSYRRDMDRILEKNAGRMFAKRRGRRFATPTPKCRILQERPISICKRSAFCGTTVSRNSIGPLALIQRRASIILASNANLNPGRNG